MNTTWMLTITTQSSQLLNDLLEPNNQHR